MERLGSYSGWNGSGRFKNVCRLADDSLVRQQVYGRKFGCSHAVNLPVVGVALQIEFEQHKTPFAPVALKHWRY